MLKTFYFLYPPLKTFSDRLLAKLSRYREAVAAFEKANRLSPDNPETVYGLALAHKATGDLKVADELLKRLIEADRDSQVAELARQARREIGLETLKSQGLRIDAVMYCLGALELFASKPRNEIFSIVSEIALMGRNGLDINDPRKTHRLDSLEGEFTGLHLLCLLYVGFRIYDESVSLGADLSSEYRAALRLYSNQIDES